MPLSVAAGAGCDLAPGSAGWGPRLSLELMGRMDVISKGLELQGLSLRYEDNTYSCTLREQGGQLASYQTVSPLLSKNE